MQHFQFEKSDIKLTTLRSVLVELTQSETVSNKLQAVIHILMILEILFLHQLSNKYSK
jgi:hypothetical protein